MNLDNEEKVRVLAYEIWEKAGCPEGDGVEFWLQAESELGNIPQCTGTKKAAKKTPRQKK